MAPRVTCPSRRLRVILPAVLSVALLAGGTRPLLAAEPEPTSRFRLTVRYSFDSTLSNAGGRLPLYTEHLSGRVRTGFTTPWGQFVQSGVSQYDSTARQGAFLHEESYWKFYVDRVDVAVRAGNLRAGTGLGWVPAYDMTGVQILRGSGRRAVDTIEALTPDPALLATVHPSEWSWEATALPFAHDLAQPLPAGSTDFGFQAGSLGRDLMGEGADYANPIMSSGGIRHGLTNNVTAEAYAAAANEWLNRGAGVVADLGLWGAVSASASVSRYGRQTGHQWTATYAGNIGALRYFANAQHRSPHYVDALRLTRRTSAGLPSAYQRRHSLGVSVPSPGMRGRLRFNYVHVGRDGVQSPHSVLNIAHAAPLSDAGRWYAGGFASATEQNYGLFLGFSLPLGRTTATPSESIFQSNDRSAPASSLRRAPVSISGSGSYDFSGRVRVESSLSRNYANEVLQ